MLEVQPCIQSIRASVPQFVINDLCGSVHLWFRFHFEWTSISQFKLNKHTDHQQRKCANYRMQTDKSLAFQAMKVEYIIKDLLDSRLKNVRYDTDTCNFITKQLCKDIREKTKQFQCDRCRLITLVLIGQDSDQSVQVAARCLWNTATDNFAAATFRNSSIYAVAVVYGVYLD